MAADPMAQLSQFQSQLPQCIQPAVSQAVASTGCGADPQCICSHSSFFALIMGSMWQSCSPADVQKTVTLLTQLCPKLNDNQSYKVIDSVSVISALAIVSVILRLISRKIGKVKLWWDDYLIVLAMLVGIGELGTMLIGTRFGLGKHFITLSPPQITAYLKIFWTVQVLFSFSITFVKMSILCFYRRIFTSRRMFIILILTGCFNMAWFLAQFLSVMLSCRPLAFFWNKAIPNGRCIDENAVSYGITAASLVMDIIVFCIPIPSLWKIQRSLSQKLGLIGLFATSSLVCIAGIVRIPLLIQLDTSDLTWTIVNSGIWIQVETKMGIVCACLPTMLPLFRFTSKTLRSQFTKLSSRRGHSSDEGKGGSSDVPAYAPDGEFKKIEKTHKPKEWFSLAMSNLSKEDRDVESKSQEELVEVQEVR